MSKKKRTDPMKHKLFLAAALIVSCIFSGTVGGLLALRFGMPGVLLFPTIRTRDIEVIGSDGTTRISLGSEKNQPSLRFFTPEGVPLIRLAVDPVTPYLSSDGAPYLMPKIDINDGAGNPTIGLVANRNQRGIMTFNSATLPERMALGYFGITDDGTDTGIWGLQVLGDLGGKRMNRIMGVATFNGRDTNLVWPMYSPPNKVK